MKPAEKITSKGTPKPRKKTGARNLTEAKAAAKKLSEEQKEKPSAKPKEEEDDQSDLFKVIE